MGRRYPLPRARGGSRKHGDDGKETIGGVCVCSTPWAVHGIPRVQRASGASSSRGASAPCRVTAGWRHRRRRRDRPDCGGRASRPRHPRAGPPPRRPGRGRAAPHSAGGGPGWPLRVPGSAPPALSLLAASCARLSTGKQTMHHDRIMNLRTTIRGHAAGTSHENKTSLQPH